MKIYLAARYGRNAEMRDYAADLKERGLDVGRMSPGTFMRRLILVALMLALGSPAMLTRTHDYGWRIKTVETVDGTFLVYRDLAGCTLTFRGIQMQTVDLRTCAS